MQGSARGNAWTRKQANRLLPQTTEKGLAFSALYSNREGGLRREMCGRGGGDSTVALSTCSLLSSPS